MAILTMANWSQMLSTPPLTLWLSLYVSPKRLYMHGLQAPSSHLLPALLPNAALGDVRLPPAGAGLPPPENGMVQRRTLRAPTLKALPARAAGRQDRDYRLPNSEDESYISTKPVTQSGEEDVRGVIQQPLGVTAKPTAPRRPGEVTFLKPAAVERATKQACRSAEQDSPGWVPDSRRRLGGGVVGDGALGSYTNEQLATEVQGQCGKTLVATMLLLIPSSGRHGSGRPPRSWKALRGWRRLIDFKSRNAVVREAWNVVACDFT